MLKLSKIYKQKVFIAKNRINFLSSVFTVSLTILFSVSYSTASQVTLAWEPSTSTDVTGYKVHVGTASRSYSQSFDAGNTTTYTVSTLTTGGIYYFSVTAYDSSGNTSGYSNEVTNNNVASGDLTGDGVVGVADALRALQITTGEVSVTSTDLANGDVAPLLNGKPSPDGKVSIEDALLILQKTVGSISW